MDLYIKLLFLFAGTAFVTWWFLLGLLNPFIDAAIAIVKCALEAFLTFFFGCINDAGNVIAPHTKPIRNTIKKMQNIKRKIHVPSVVKAVFYFILGTTIIVLDHLYATKIYAEDATTFYHFKIFESTYWITELAFLYGGFFIFLAALYLLGAVLRTLDRLLNRTIRVSIVIYR